MGTLLKETHRAALQLLEPGQAADYYELIRGGVHPPVVSALTRAGLVEKRGSSREGFRWAITDLGRQSLATGTNLGKVQPKAIRPASTRRPARIPLTRSRMPPGAQRAVLEMLDTMGDADFHTLAKVGGNGPILFALTRAGLIVRETSLDRPSRWSITAAGRAVLAIPRTE